MNKKGFVQYLVLIVVIGLALGAVFALYFMWGFAAPIVADSVDMITNTAVSSVNSTPQNQSNLTMAVNVAAQIPRAFTDQYEWIGYSVLIVTLLGFVALCVYVRMYPWLIGVWFGIMFILILFTIIFSWAYSSASDSNAYLRNIYNQSPTNDYVMRNMPIILTAIGVIGGLVMLMIVSRGDEGGGF